LLPETSRIQEAQRKQAQNELEGPKGPITYAKNLGLMLITEEFMKLFGRGLNSTVVLENIG
jgi:hypothetical protein